MQGRSVSNVFCRYAVNSLRPRVNITAGIDTTYKLILYAERLRINDKVGELYQPRYLGRF